MLGVRLVMELSYASSPLVPFLSRAQFDPAGFSQLERQIIMKAVIDAESLIYTHNVQHRDIHPRNIIVPGKFAPSHSRKVVFIDFGKSVVGRSRFPEDPTEEQQYLQSILITPLLRWNEAWWPYLQTFFGAWIDWDWQPWLEYHYGSTSASLTEKMRSVWLPAFLTSPPPRPPGFSYSSAHRTPTNPSGPMEYRRVQNGVPNFEIFSNITFGGVYSAVMVQHFSDTNV